MIIQFRKIAAVLTTAGLLFGTAATAALADSSGVTISGNGADSTNTVILKDHCSNKVIQSNSTTVVTIAAVSANSGGNEAERNTGGNVTINSGSADASLVVGVDGGSNEATAPNCCACSQNVGPVTIENNGVDSTNKVVKKQSQHNFVLQRNRTRVFTLAKVKANSGHNEAESNTGTGVEVTSDPATASLGVSVTAPSNTLNP